MKKIKTLNDHELEKFSRQIILEKVGETGQLKILNSSILIVGCGGLGSTAATYLSMSGILNFGLESIRIKLMVVSLPPNKTTRVMSIFCLGSNFSRLLKSVSG